MALSDYTLHASIAVSDMARATAFYEGTLGLSPVKEQYDGSRIYASGGRACLHVYPSPNHAGTGTATLATWYADDLGRAVDELGSRGVSFEQYDEPPVVTDERGIAGDGTVAWFKDPDGNTFAVQQRDADD